MLGSIGKMSDKLKRLKEKILSKDIIIENLENKINDLFVSDDF